MAKTPTATPTPSNADAGGNGCGPPSAADCLARTERSPARQPRPGDGGAWFCCRRLSLSAAVCRCRCRPRALAQSQFADSGRPTWTRPPGRRGATVHLAGSQTTRPTHSQPTPTPIAIPWPWPHAPSFVPLWSQRIPAPSTKRASPPSLLGLRFPRPHRLTDTRQ